MTNPQVNTQTRDHTKREEQDHKAAEVARTVTNEAARVGEQSARASADLARRGAETARDSLQAGLNRTQKGKPLSRSDGKAFWVGSGMFFKRFYAQLSAKTMYHE